MAAPLFNCAPCFYETYQMRPVMAPYGIGNVAFLLIDRCTWGDDREEPGWFWHRVYDTYQWCMIKSSDFDTGHCGLWKPANSQG